MSSVEARPDELVVVDVDRLLDVDTQVVRGALRLAVRGDRVEDVLAADAPVAESARVIDLHGLTVLPGLIDCHTHLIGDLEYADLPAVNDSAESELLKGVRNARATLAAGFTTVRDVGTYRAFLDVRLREGVEAGWIEGPRMQCAAGYITAPGGGGEVTGEQGVDSPPDMRRGVVRTPADVRDAVRRFVDGGADVIKVIVTGAVLTRGTEPGRVELEAALVEAAVDEAARLGRSVAAHAHGAEGISLAARAGARSIEHGSLIDEDGIRLLVEHGTFLVADVYVGDWIEAEGRRAGWPEETLRKNAETTAARRAGFRAALAAGVRLAFGTDAGVYPHGGNAIQLGHMVHLGMTPWQAIRSATTVAAKCLGWEDRVGSLAPGRFADLVAVADDPLEDVAVLREPALVMKGGAIVVNRQS